MDAGTGEVVEPGDGRVLTPAFVAIVLAELGYFVGMGVLLGATTLFAKGPLAAGPTGVGIALGAFSVSTLVLRPFVGRWVDTSGRTRFMLLGTSLFAVLALGHLLVDSLAALVVLRLLLGVAEAMFFVSFFAAIADLAPPGHAGRALSFASVSLYVGIATGPVLGQTLLEWRGFGAVWVGAALCGLLALLAALRVPETLPERPAGEAGPDERPPLIHPRAIIPGLALWCGIVVAMGYLGFAVLRAGEVGLPAWGLAYLTFGGTVVVARIVLADLADRVDHDRLVVAALLVTALGAALVGVAGTRVGLLVGAVVLGLGSALLTPAVFAMVFALVPASQRGAGAATTSIFIDLSFSLGPVLVGVLASGLGIGPAITTTALVALVGAAMMAVVRPSGSAGGARLRRAH